VFFVCDFIAKLHVSAILVGGVKASHFIEANWWVMVFVFHFLHVKKRWGRPYQKNLPVTKSPKISQHNFYHRFFASAILAEEPA